MCLRHRDVKNHVYKICYKAKVERVYSINLVQSFINKSEQFGINVKVIISDQGPNFQRLANALGLITEKPYFTFNNKNYFYSFDLLHLFKSIKNNQFKYEFHFGKCIIA